MEAGQIFIHFGSGGDVFINNHPANLRLTEILDHAATVALDIQLHQFRIISLESIAH